MKLVSLVDPWATRLQKEELPSVRMSVKRKDERTHRVLQVLSFVWPLVTGKTYPSLRPTKQGLGISGLSSELPGSSPEASATFPAAMVAGQDVISENRAQALDHLLRGILRTQCGP